MAFSKETPQPIALIGMSCRLPGGVSSTSQLWDLLANGKSSLSEIPKSRFNVDAFYNSDSTKTGTISGNGGYFLEGDIRLFDNAFFGLNNLETKYIDPQQRQLLEIVYECFESAGVTLEEVSGANVGCYVANFTTDFVNIQAKDPDTYHRYSATGFGPTILANRISYTFNLQGPSVVLDTACSSSLYALHMACASLNAGECDSAIVAGANLIQSPEAYIAMTKAGVLSSTSISHTFDASADGYGRGEGIAALYLKRMGSLKASDPVRSIIRGTAVNSNGHTSGITMPGKSGQEGVIRKAYSMVGLSLDSTSYVETHGTGTSVGDPIEVEAISKCFSTKCSQPLLIGSVKPNVGHGEAVSGITSIIKATLSLEHQIIPPTIGIRNLNPQLKLEERNIRVVTAPEPWPTVAVERISVNSFGYGGANAHAILDSARTHIPSYRQDVCNNVEAADIALILPFSANNVESLTRNIEAVMASDAASKNVRNLAYTLGSHRSSLPTRGYVLACKETVESSLSITTPKLQPSNDPQMAFAFIFTGQGAQSARMAAALLDRFPVFGQTIDRLDACLKAIPEAPVWSIKEIISENAQHSTINLASRSQPVCTAIQIGLVALLKDWSVQPSVVIGHSSGEICAAYASGHITSEEAMAVAYYRGYAVSKKAKKGAMIAVGLGHEKAEEQIRTLHLQRYARIACINSPQSTTISGDSDAIDALLSAFRTQDIFVRKLQTDDKAYHSHLMEEIGQYYEDLLVPIFARRGHKGLKNLEVKLFSSVTSELAEQGLASTPSYWRKNLEAPVLFSSSLKLLLSSGSYHMIEVGPHPALAQPVRDIQQAVDNIESSYSSTLSRETNDVISMLHLAGSLFLRGYKLPFASINGIGLASAADTPRRGARRKSDVFDLVDSPGGTIRVIHDLPTYSWNHQHLLWNESRISSEYRNLRYRRHDLLGSRIPGSPGRTWWWRNTLKLQEVPWIQDHRLGQSIVFPAGAYLAMAIEGLCQIYDYSIKEKIALRDVHLLNLLVLEAEGDGVELTMQLESADASIVSDSDIWWRFEICSRTADILTVHAHGLVTMQGNLSLTKYSIPFLDSDMEEQDIRTWYSKMAKEGLCFGPEFHSLLEIKMDRGKRLPGVVAKTIYRQGGMSGSSPESNYTIHPATIDAMLQAAIVGSAAGVIQKFRGKIPVVVGDFHIFPGKAAVVAEEVCNIRTISEKVGFESIVALGELGNDSGQIIAQMKGVRYIPYRESSLQASVERNPYLRILWKPSISTMTGKNSNAFVRYLEQFVTCLPTPVRTSDVAYLAGTVDLITHRKGRAKILELREDYSNDLEELITSIGIGGNYKHFDSFTGAIVTSDGSIEINSRKLKPEPLFDLVIVSSRKLTSMVSSYFHSLTQYLVPNATLVFASDFTVALPFDQNQISLLLARATESNTTITVARCNPTSPEESIVPDSARIILIILTTTLPLSRVNQAIIDAISKSLEVSVDVLGLHDISKDTICPDSIVITTVELEAPLLSVVTPIQLEHLKILFENAPFILWITGGSLYKASKPDYAVVLGVSRSLMLERPSLKMPVFDIDLTTPPDISAQNAVLVLKEVMSSVEVPDTEYRQHEGVIYHSRIIPDVALNNEFRRAQEEIVTQVPLEESGYLKMGMKNVRDINSLRFEEAEKDELVPRGYVEVQVRARGINTKDWETLTDKVDARNGTCSLEFSGVITSTGSQTAAFKPGDRVVVLAPNYGGTYERVPEWACCMLRDDEAFEIMATIPLVFATALHALEERANLSAGQSILIHSASDGVGIAAIQIARLKGAEIFTTVETDSMKAFLMETLHIPSSHIFKSDSTVFPPGIMKATAGKGVDIVLSSLPSDLLQASLDALTDYGTFVGLGKPNIAESGALNMRVLGRGVTMTAFDLSEMFWSKEETTRQIIHRLLYRSIELLREEKIRPVSPLKIFPVSQIIEAFRYFAARGRIGKVALTLSPTDTIPAIFKYRTRFNAQKTYLLVGCLGGLGRSLARWMFKRDARHFVFMGRSGTSKVAAQSLVAELREAGADVEVVQGDVGCYTDVERTVVAAKQPIGGVVQAAMSIHYALFNETTHEKWHSGISQKVQGSANIYKALSTHQNLTLLDFFLLMSSVTGSVGVATESNYCGAGAFQDAFGAHLQSLGHPGISLGLGMISEVGFLHENPSTEAVLLRKGLHPLTEEEFLQVIDGAIDSLKNVDESSDMAWGRKHYMEGHILTGLELQGFQKIRDMGFSRGAVVLEDPRLTYVAGEFAASEPTSENSEANGTAYPRAVVSALARNRNDSLPSEDLIQAVATVVIARIATLLLVPVAQIQTTTYLADFGIESMLAAEFRSDMFRTFKVDVPFAVLMAQGTQIRSISEFIGQDLLKRK